MFGKPKPFSSPSDAQANEKLALYVYEYLVYSGAQKAAQTFLQEIGWEKHIVPNEAPGFLFSWWSVFWDLYCAAPERRDVLKHSPDARAFYDYGLANPGFASGGPQPTLMAGPGLHYVQGRNGPPPMIQHQQYITQPRQMFPPGIARSSDVKIPGLMPMGEQHLEAFLSSPSAAAAAAVAFRPNSNIPSLPIASAPTVTLRHQPRPVGPRGPLMTNGGAVAPINSSSSTASSSFSGSSSNGDFQPGMHQHQFGRSHPFQQRSLPLKMSPCTPNGMLPSQQQPQWSPGLGPPVDFLGNPQSTSKMSPDVGTTTTPMIFDAALMDSLPPAPQPQPPTSSSGGGSGSTGDGFAFFDQTDALPVEDVVVSSGQPQQPLQPPQISSQISQLLSPSPLQQGSRQEAPRPKTTIIDEALLLGAPELEILTGSDDPTGVVEAPEQSISRPHPPPAVQIFDSEQMKTAETQAILFPSSDDLRTVQNLVDAMHDPTSNDLLPPASSIQKPFCPLKDIETSATLFLQE